MLTGWWTSVAHPAPRFVFAKSAQSTESGPLSSATRFTMLGPRRVAELTATSTELRRAVRQDVSCAT